MNFIKIKPALCLIAPLISSAGISQDAVFFSVTSVEIAGSEVPYKLGRFNDSGANKWSSIGKTKSKFRVTSFQPKIHVKTKLDGTCYYLVKFSQEDSYRYIYLNDNGNGYMLPYHGHLVVYDVKFLPDNVTEIVPRTPLPYGEYAIWSPSGSSVPKKNDYKTKQEYKDAVNTFSSGILWAFGVDDTDSD